MILFSLLGFALLILTFISLNLFRNSLYFKAIHDFENISNPTNSSSLVSILIPARNEEYYISQCVRSAINQTYEQIEVIVLNDESTDKTGDILSDLVLKNPTSLKVIQGTPKPDEWLGKNWACHQLSKAAKGKYIVFLDADVRLEPHVIDALIERFQLKPSLGLVSVWPEQILITFWEHVIIPIIYYALLGFLYLRYTEEAPRWMPSFIRKKMQPLFAAACGQFMAFDKSIYDQIEGHSSVKNKVVEDVELAKMISKKGYSVLNVSGKDAVYCRMYRNLHEIKEGFRKNFFAGFGYNIPLFIFSALIHLIAFILPLIMLFYYIHVQFWHGAIFAYALLLIPFFHRMWLHLLFNWNLRFIPTHILGVLWFQKLGLTVLFDYLFKRKSTWKNRSL